MSVFTTDKMTCPRGCYSYFVRDGRDGIKCYYDRNDRNRCYRTQRLFHSKGLSPYCWFPFQFTNSDGRTVYAFYTEVAECWNWHISEGNGDKWGTAASDMKAQLKRLYQIHWSDDHAGNVGFVGDKVVIVDCDMEHFSNLPNDWYEEYRNIDCANSRVHDSANDAADRELLAALYA